MWKMLAIVVAAGMAQGLAGSAGAQPADPEGQLADPEANPARSCCVQDAITGGRRRQPTQAEIDERIGTPSPSVRESQSVDTSPEAGREAGSTYEQLTGQRLGPPARPAPPR